MRPWTSVATGTRDDHHAPTLLGRSLRLQSCTSCSESGEAIAVCGLEAPQHDLLQLHAIATGHDHAMLDPDELTETARTSIHIIMAS